MHTSTEALPDLRFPARYKLRAYARFLSIIWRANPALMSFRFLLLFLGAFLQPVEVFFFAMFISAIASGRADEAPFLIGVVIASYGVRRLVTEITYSRVDDWFSRASGLASEQYIFHHLAKLEPEALNRTDVRRSLDFVREDLWRLRRLTDRSEWFVRSVLKFVGASGLALAAPWWVFLLAIADAMAQAANFWYESRNDIWAATWNSLDGRRLEYTRYMFLNADEFRELRMLGADDIVLKKFARACQNVLKRFRAIAAKSARNRVALTAFHVGAYAAVIVIMGHAAFEGPAALAALYVSLSLFGLMGDALNGISGSITYLWTDMEILAYMNRLLDFPQESRAGRSIPRELLIVTFDRVSFRYPNTQKDALSNISLTIREGEHWAVVGENGAGKSTFLRLLSGLIKPTKGRILVNGKPLQAYQPDAWREAFHLMLQDARLYQDFVRDNLMYGAPRGKRPLGIALPQSVKISGADVVIDSLPQGYKTFIGNWVAPPGIVPHQVSGGQQQRLLISRTLTHGGRILGFDEPTSAMDANAEMRFFENLLDAAGNRGLLFISHRFSTVRRADRIVVFHEGRMIEQGSHEELLSRNGKYAELYRQQAQWYA